MPDAAVAAATASRDYAYYDSLPYELGPAMGHRAKIGFVVLAPDWTTEFEMYRICALDGVAVWTNRIPMAPVVTLETLRAMERDISAATDLIMPGFDLDVVAFGCTSATIAIGKEGIFRQIQAVRPTAKCTTPMVAGLAGMEKLGLKRIALLTPYIEEVNLGMRRFVEEHGVLVPVMGTFNNSLDVEVAAIARQSIKDAILKVGSSDRVDGVFVSCTSLCVTPVMDEAEAALGKPVMSSNQAMAWHSLRLAGVGDAVPGFGRLLTV